MVSAEDIAREVERSARALGVWLRATIHAGPLRVTARASVAPHGWTLSNEQHGDGLALTLRTWSVGDDGRTHSDAGVKVDASTAALILLGHRRGLRVDIGECPACRDRGYPRRGSVHATRDGQRKFAARLRACGLTVVESGSHGRYETDGTCSTCTVDGQPTGRHLLAWERAILDAMPRDLGYDAHRYASREAAERDVVALARLTKRDPADYAARETGGCWRLHEVKPGDPATRTALTVLAHRLADPEHAAVFGDWLAEHRDPSAFPAPREGLAAVLHAWLAGPCQACSGSGRVSAKTGQPLAAGGAWWADDIGGCQMCHGHGVTLGRFDGEIVAMLREISQAAEQDAIEAAQ